MSQGSGNKARVIVIGAGIGGLTAAALLAKRGYRVTIFEQAFVPGGCASTFRRRGFTFDVGATQVAGLESGGIHHRIFTELEIEPPEAIICNPACAVFLPGESIPINIWYEPSMWKAECERQFPGSEKLWRLFATLFRISWEFQCREPILPPANLWDLWQLIKALRFQTLIATPFTPLSVGDILRFYKLDKDLRLKTFLDLQLKLYSQVDAEETALLYAATVLGVSQAPHGLYHLKGSMQVLSDRLVEAFKRYNGSLFLRHTVKRICVTGGKATAVIVENQKTGESWKEDADIIIANVTVQNLVKLLGEDVPAGYRYRVDKLPPASGAFVVYLGVKQEAIPPGCPLHLQFLYDYNSEIAENNSLFVSVSYPGDGRASEGMATIIASSFTDTKIWWHTAAYEELKNRYMEDAILRLSKYFHLTNDTIIYKEAATPRTFERFTGREYGIVGGIGQRVSTFGFFSFSTRTPIKQLWLVGDSTHPGEGTAGVSYSALTAVRQIEADGNSKMYLLS